MSEDGIMGQVTWTPERRAAQSALMSAQKTRWHAEHDCAEVHGQANFQDADSYGAVHRRLRRLLQPKPCHYCGAEGKSEVARLKGAEKKYDSVRQCWYSTDPEDYIPLCHDCHLEYDRG